MRALALRRPRSWANPSPAIRVEGQVLLASAAFGDPPEGDRSHTCQVEAGGEPRDLSGRSARRTRPRRPVPAAGGQSGVGRCRADRGAPGARRGPRRAAGHRGGGPGPERRGRGPWAGRGRTGALQVPVPSRPGRLSGHRPVRRGPPGQPAGGRTARGRWPVPGRQAAGIVPRGRGPPAVSRPAGSAGAVESAEEWRMQLRRGGAGTVRVAVSAGVDRDNTGAVRELRWLLRELPNAATRDPQVPRHQRRRRW